MFNYVFNIHGLPLKGQELLDLKGCEHLCCDDNMYKI